MKWRYNFMKSIIKRFKEFNYSQTIEASNKSRQAFKSNPKMLFTSVIHIRKHTPMTARQLEAVVLYLSYIFYLIS